MGLGCPELAWRVSDITETPISFSFLSDGWCVSKLVYSSRMREEGGKTPLADLFLCFIGQN